MYIVLDSNIWISEWGLSSPKGSALQFFAKRNNAIIVIPEVIKREVKIHLTKAIKNNCDQIARNHRELLHVFKKLPEIVLPTEQEIDNCVEKLFDNVNVKNYEIHFCLDSAKQSLDKIFFNNPPSDKNQQFKDGVIWADCLSLLQKDDVIFVTEDKAFYEERNAGKGLAINLREETDNLPYQIQIYSSLNKVLEGIRNPIKINESDLVNELYKQEQQSIDDILERNGFGIDEKSSIDYSTYITENPDYLYLDFTITFKCNDLRDEERSQGLLYLKGDGLYEHQNANFSKLRIQEEELTFRDIKGEHQSKKTHRMAGSITIGHATVEHTIRHPVS